jgi:hypothetical protein
MVQVSVIVVAPRLVGASAQRIVSLVVLAGAAGVALVVVTPAFEFVSLVTALFDVLLVVVGPTEAPPM